MPTRAYKQFRITRGQTINGSVWSSVATTIVGRFLAVYDSGDVDTFRVNEIASGSSRAQVNFDTKPTIARENGYIVSGAIGFKGTAPVRGQTYVIVSISHPDDAQDFSDVLCQGYNYFGHPVELGSYVEPGPAGGHGAITRVTKAATALTAGTVVLAAVPTGALWHWIAGAAEYKATATAGTRSVRARFRDGSANAFGKTLIGSPIANGVLGFVFGPNRTDSIAIASQGAVDSPDAVTFSLVFASPNRWLPAGYDLAITDTAAIDNADTGQLEAQVEEWVIPN